MNQTLLQLTDELVDAAQAVVEISNHRGGCGHCGDIVFRARRILPKVRTAVRVEKNKLDHQFAVQMGMEEEGWPVEFFRGTRWGL